MPNSFADPLDAPGRSFLGGLPFLPPEMEWPTIEEGGEPAGLIFAGQIDLADLPDFEGRPTLPEAGVLYFFYKDTWEMGDESDEHEEGVMPCAVLYSKSSSQEWARRAQPLRMVAANDAMASAATYIDAADYRNRGHFRFNLTFAPFRSAPEHIELSDVPLGPLSDKEALELSSLLGVHPSTGKLGAGYVEFAGLETSWVYACEHEGLSVLRRLQRDSLVDAVGSRARGERTHLGFHNPAKFMPDLIFCWAVIAAFARGLLHPLPDYATEREAGTENDWVRDEALRWLRLTADLPLLGRPSLASAERFLEFLCGIAERRNARRISHDLQMRFYTLCQKVFRYAANLASEAGQLSSVPKELQAELDIQPTIRRTADDVDLYVTMHHMLGHGSYDHTAVQPNQRTDKVLLLRLDCGDPMLLGSEGSYHFWIDPAKLAASDFSEVELTC
ncbi:MAG: hypothetical protein A4S17_04520 [Proteobacteria bacterium HN_bin10]|nr:MAG: hypothetical protein A4S17_04520 [Proteobacteria bacterium HN_bin10]